MSARKVLVADDEPDIRRLVRTHLTLRDPWAVLEAEDGARALELWAEQAIDLAVLDQRMPNLTGTEVARRLREEHRFAGPIILFSAYIDAAVEEVASGLSLLTIPKSDMSLLRETVRDQLGS